MTGYGYPVNRKFSLDDVRAGLSSIRVCASLKLILLYALACSLLLLRVEPATAQQLSFNVYGTDFGLSNLRIDCVRQDHIGFLLVCTESGLFRFNGNSFVRFGIDNGLPERGISRDLQITPDGHLFLVHAGTIYSVQDQASPYFVAVPGGDGLDREDGVKTAILGNQLLFAALGRIWIAGSAPGSRVEPLLPDALIGRFPVLRSVTSVAAAGDTVWLGCGSSFCRLRWGPGPTGQIQCGDLQVLKLANTIEPQEWSVLFMDRHRTLRARSANWLASKRETDQSFTAEAIPGGVGRYVGHTFVWILSRIRAAAS